MKKLIDHIQNFTSEHNSFWYLISLNIIEFKLYVKTIPRKKSIQKYKSNINFTNKALDFINVAKVLRSKGNIDSRPDLVEQDDILMVIYTLTQSIRSNIFNYHAFVKDLSWKIRMLFFVHAVSLIKNILIRTINTS